MAKKESSRPVYKIFAVTTTLLIFFAIFLLSTTAKEPGRQLDDESKKCLKCHAESRYMLTDSASGNSVRMKMYTELRIDPVLFLNGTHGKFKCTDCHSSDYTTTPHPASVKFETGYACLDCHGGDEKYASFHFETIEEEYSKSIHADSLKGDFSCWSCHNPHSYKLTGPKELIVNKVATDNGMCLSCHGNQIKFENLAGKDLPNLISKHDWLPNQALHFKNVRCLDCHAAQNDSLVVAHLIRPAKFAVKKCVQCHSTNSILMASLYKYSVSEKRSQYGFYNGVVMNEAYIIGANRNYYLNVISIVIFALTLLGITIHTIFRIRKSRSHANK